MTIAEQFEARGVAKGIAKGIAETALNFLKEGTDPQFVAKVTGLSPEEITKLTQRIN